MTPLFPPISVMECKVVSNDRCFTKIHMFSKIKAISNLNKEERV